MDIARQGFCHGFLEEMGRTENCAWIQTGVRSTNVVRGLTICSDAGLSPESQRDLAEFLFSRLFRARFQKCLVAQRLEYLFLAQERMVRLHPRRVFPAFTRVSVSPP